MFPELINYELFETYMPGSVWNHSVKIQMSHDYEGFKGRTNYASNTVGGYYASRLGALELLDNVRRQASVLVFRFETPDYYLSLGVFVVREAMRKTMGTKPLIFDTKEKLTEKVKELIFGKFGFDLNETLKKSKILENLKQKKLFEF